MENFPPMLSFMQCSKHGRQLPLCHGLLSSIAPFMHCNGIIPPGATRKIHSKLRKACVIVLMVVLHQSRAPFPLLRISHTVRGPPLQPNWCTHNPQLEQTRTTWCYIQPCTLQPCVITSDTSLDELLGA